MMTLRGNAVVAVFASLVRLYPKTSLATAFEIGILAAAALRAARARRAAAGVSAKVIEAVALPARRKRKTTSSKRKPARRAKITAPVEAT